VTIDSNLIDNVLGLSILTSIDGNLKIQGTRMTKLSGLDQLSAVGGRMCLYFPRMLNSLTGLESLEGLHNVETIGSNIIIQGNEALTDISALGNLTAINGYFSVWNNDALPHFTGIDY
jgi:hypothetical protein